MSSRERSYCVDDYVGTQPDIEDFSTEGNQEADVQTPHESTRDQDATQ
jgi:hypothetical protein